MLNGTLIASWEASSLEGVDNGLMNSVGQAVSKVKLSVQMELLSTR